MRLAAECGGALAFGAYLHAGGTRLRCPLLLIRDGYRPDVLVLHDPQHEMTISVRLPAEARENAGHLRFDREELEVMP